LGMVSASANSASLAIPLPRRRRASIGRQGFFYRGSFRERQPEARCTPQVFHDRWHLTANFRTGRWSDGRELAPIMLWREFDQSDQGGECTCDRTIWRSRLSGVSNVATSLLNTLLRPLIGAVPQVKTNGEALMRTGCCALGSPNQEDESKTERWLRLFFAI
jgi:hypothetical protein